MGTGALGMKVGETWLIDGHSGCEEGGQLKLAYDALEICWSEARGTVHRASLHAWYCSYLPSLNH